MARRRGFGEDERRVAASGRAAYRAPYAMPDGTRLAHVLERRRTHPRTPLSSVTSR